MSETNKNFDGMKRLLKLKQHEVPPPGYFNQFSGDVIARIRAGETAGAEGFLSRMEPNSWIMSLLHIFQAKPGVIGGFATSLCLLLLIGVVMVDHTDGVAAGGAMAGMQSAPDGNQGLIASVPLLPAGNSGITVSTNNRVSFQPAAAMFGSQQNPLFQPAAFLQAGQ